MYHECLLDGSFQLITMDSTGLPHLYHPTEELVFREICIFKDLSQ